MMIIPQEDRTWRGLSGAQPARKIWTASEGAGDESSIGKIRRRMVGWLLQPVSEEEKANVAC